MNTMKWLVQREYWENKGMLFWAPAVIAALMVAFTALMLIVGNNMEMHINGDSVARFHDMTAVERHQLAQAFGAAFPMIGAPLYILMAFLIFFYCLGALYDDRRDRSILFWKSLPVSDTNTVLSKALMALVAVPLIVAAIAFVASFAIILMASIALSFHGINVFGDLLSSTGFWLSPFRMLSLVPVYLLWALPTVGWLLLVSSWARSKVFLWAVGGPLMSGALLAWANYAFKMGINIEWFFQQVVLRLLGSVLPGSWFIFDHSARHAMEHADDMDNNPALQIGQFFAQAYGSLASPTLWIGVVAGVAMIAGAVWLRRWREES
jgi:ABC-2 type transport system permease protein